MRFLSSLSALAPIVLSIFLHFPHSILTLAQSSQGTGPPVPALIAFGDSILDPGNNNAVNTIIKCNFPPYGIDFIGRQPTGRFCDGRIPTDIIASKLGLKELLPAYVGTELEPQDLLTGVSFASGGAGFDPLTSKIASAISMDEQLELFKEYKEKLNGIAGEEGAASIISQSAYLVCVGSDDLANNYFSIPLTKASYDIPSYANLLVGFASTFAEGLVQQGAQTIGFFGIPPIGCVPSQRTLGGGILRDCAPGRNELATLFNSELSKELERLSIKYPGTNLVYIDIYTPLFDIIQNPIKYGFETSTKGCCGTGDIEVSVLCNKFTSLVCSEISKYVFWDSYHPTEKAYEVLVDSLYSKYISALLKK